MKTVAILTAIVTVMVAATANAGQPTSHQPGSPLQQGKYCWVYTGGNGYGYWDPCDGSYKYPRGVSLRDYPEELVIGAENGEGGSGGGGGGGGGGR